jgi:tetratricopeptide (TPR) repeat protein
MTASSGLRLPRLLQHLEGDPGNLQLIADTAWTARDEGDLATALELIDRYGSQASPTPNLLNLAGLIALSQERFTDAADIFEALRANAPQEPAIVFNLAWSKAMLGDWITVDALLDETVVAAAPRAAALKVQALHHLGDAEKALAWGRSLAKARPQDQALLGALALAAMDAEDFELARAYASQATETHEGLSTLGSLMLSDDRVEDALALFDRALAVQPNSARGLLGKGLSLLSQGDFAQAAACLDEAAEVFGDHLGSWVAAGWAHFATGDEVASRARFERAMAKDDTFAEVHGGLAVLDILGGEIDSGRRRTDTALRLDRNCLSGLLARSMLLIRDGDPASAERLRNMALNSPVGPKGQTIAQAMTAMAERRGR